jgi:hypothetical protein
MRSDDGSVNPVAMDFKAIAQEWQIHGFVILPGYIPSDELSPGTPAEDRRLRRCGSCQWRPYGRPERCQWVSLYLAWS